MSWYRDTYLRSHHWNEFRLYAIANAGFRCQRCGAKGSLDVHHRTYARLYHERLPDVRVLCRACHKRAERLRRLRKAVLRVFL